MLEGDVLGRREQRVAGAHNDEIAAGVREYSGREATVGSEPVECGRGREQLERRRGSQRAINVNSRERAVGVVDGDARSDRCDDLAELVGEFGPGTGLRRVLDGPREQCRNPPRRPQRGPRRGRGCACRRRVCWPRRGEEEDCSHRARDGDESEARPSSASHITTIRARAGSARRARDGPARQPRGSRSSSTGVPWPGPSPARDYPVPRPRAPSP